MDELKPCDINLLEKRLRDLNTGLKKMCSHAPKLRLIMPC